MDREHGDTQDGSVDLDQAVCDDRGIVGSPHEHPAGHAQVAIKPRVPTNQKVWEEGGSRGMKDPRQCFGVETSR